MSNYDAYNSKQTCPYCNNKECYADWVDVEIGLVQCGPFFCEDCGACEIGPYDTKTELTANEKKYYWYEPNRSHFTAAPTLDGMPINHQLAKSLYDIGLLDEKN